MARKNADPKPHARIILFVDETMLVEGKGYRPVFVVEGEPGYRENGTWPYEGKAGQTLPWFYGPAFADAQKAVAAHNERLGVTGEEAWGIVARSMSAGSR